MIMKKHWFFIIIFLLLYCTENKETYLYINGGPVIDRTHHFPVDTLGTYDSTLILEILSDPICDTITIKLNDEILTNFTIEGNKISVVKPIPTQGCQYKLEIESDLGDVSTVCSIPGGFKIPKPPSLSVQPGWDCEIHWDKAIYAECYDVSISYFDTFPTHPYAWDTSYIFDDTSTIIIPREKINYVGTLVVIITAIDGTSLLSGDEGNIQGDGNGFWLGKSITRRAIKVEY